MKNTIKNFEDACKHLGIDPTALPDVSKLPVKHQKAITANYKLTIIAEALNDGWQPNWNDWNEYKYYPWFEVEASEEQPAGSGFSLVLRSLVYECVRRFAPLLQIIRISKVRSFTV